MHRLRNMACVRGIGPYQLGLRRDRGVRLVAPTAQRLRRDPQIPGGLFDRLGLRRIRAARLGQQPDGLRLELRRVSRSFCHGSIISHRVRGNAEQKSVHITTHPIAGEIILEGYLLRVRGWGRKAARSMPAWSEGIMAPRQTKAKLMKRKTGKPMLDWILKHG